LPSHPGNESHPVGEPWSRGERGLRRRLDDAPKIREAPRLLHPQQVDCGIAKLGGDFKEQGGLANLPRPCEKLDSAWCGFS